MELETVKKVSKPVFCISLMRFKLAKFVFVIIGEWLGFSAKYLNVKQGEMRGIWRVENNKNRFNRIEYKELNGTLMQWI